VVTRVDHFTDDEMNRLEEVRAEYERLLMKAGMPEHLLRPSCGERARRRRKPNAVLTRSQL
jgi:hypothetical protein